jgi:hypothetical protein
MSERFIAENSPSKLLMQHLGVALLLDEKAESGEDLNYF